MIGSKIEHFAHDHCSKFSGGAERSRNFQRGCVIDFVADAATGPEVHLTGVKESFTLKRVDLLSQESARSALDEIEERLNALSSERGQIGSVVSRLGVASRTLQAQSENYAAAESRIKDADIAFESSQLTRLNILQQAASAVLDQANLQPSLALTLLQ